MNLYHRGLFGSVLRTPPDNSVDGRGSSDAEIPPQEAGNLTSGGK